MQQRSSLASILPKLERLPWRGIHSVVAVRGDLGVGWICLHRDCAFASREISDMAAHVVANQWTMGTRWSGKEEDAEGEEG